MVVSYEQAKEVLRVHFVIDEADSQSLAEQDTLRKKKVMGKPIEMFIVHMKK
jgi:hypothetical protein